MNMIRRIFHQLGRDGRRVHLQPHERAAGRQLLVELMAQHPPRPLALGQDVRRFRLSLWQAFWVRPALLAGCLVVAVGAGTVAAAERSLPGDLLYVVKVHVTEGLHGWLAVTQEAKARLAVSRAQRRLEEAARLAAAQRMSVGVLVDVETRLQAQADATTRELQQLQAGGNAEAAAQLGSRYEVLLKTNERVLLNITTTVQAHGDDDADAGALGPVISRLQAQGAAAAEARSDAEAQVADAGLEQAKASADRERTAAKQALASVQTKLDRRRSRLTPEAAAQIQAQLDAAQQALSDGQQTYDAGAYGAAFARFGVAERTAIGAGLLLRAQEQLRVQVALPLRRKDESPMSDPSDAAANDSDDDERARQGADDGTSKRLDQPAQPRGKKLKPQEAGDRAAPVGEGDDPPQVPSRRRR